ncbi:hypothetical protein OG342_32975 [Streptomyces bobili]|uniref:hypothetical protein n=1 Tax=Streptomyces bobili TaxID=67280 RepID=UPI002257EF54|nr:hypothetical protein [Streptomyces bobili]MCX5527613.1 hypothetical protein [Streptomyces bobili]
MSTAHDFDFLHSEWQGRHRGRTGFLDTGSGWAPAFSAGGDTWVTDWIMDFTRPPTPLPACGTP